MLGCRRKRLWAPLLAMAILLAVMRYTFHHLQHVDDVMTREQVQSFNGGQGHGRVSNQDGAHDSGRLLKNINFLRETSLIGATVISRSNTSWSRNDGACNGDTAFVKTVLHSPAGDAPIYVHPKSEDIWVSATIIRGEVWEGDLVTKLYNYFKQDDELVLVDIGGNIGVYGLTIARMGRKAVLVEPLPKNVKKLCLSIRDGNYSHAYIVHNAVSNTRVKVALGSYANNVGGTYVEPVTSENQETAQTMLLDDLLEVFHLRKVVMKMDIEGHEDEALLGAETFFAKVDVRYLLMEWNTHINKPEAKHIIDFLTKHNMVPVHPIDEHILALNSSWEWPGDVLWKKDG